MKALVARLTPNGMGGVATIALWGPHAITLLETIRTSRQQLDQSPTLTRIGEGKQVENVVLVQRPNGFEMHCHGGQASAAWIIDLCQRHGAEEVGWHAWLAYSASSPLQAQAAVALTHAKTLRCAAILLDQWHGALQHRIEAALASSMLEPLEGLLTHATTGLHLTKPWRVVLAGPPNVGKSALCNAILGRQRAITSPVPGTTRDALTSWTAIDGWPVELVDTAGIRNAIGSIEVAGITMARQQMENADLCLWLMDPGQEQVQEPPVANPRTLIVVTKADLRNQWPRQPEDLGLAGHVRTSAVTGAGIPDLLHAIAAALVPRAPVAGAPVPFTDHQVATVQMARHAALHGDVNAARAVLHGLLTFKA